MKLLFISDIHGIKSNLEIIKNKFNEFNCDKLIVLGDLYYLSHYFRDNEDYDVQYVKDFLESFKDKLLCIRGNCDSDEDINASSFNIIDEISSLQLENKELYLTHGHIYNEKNWKKDNSILVFGHYHIPFILEEGTKLFINPGSISQPRNNNPTYLYFDGKEFIIYDIYDKIVDRRKIF